MKLFKDEAEANKSENLGPALVVNKYINDDVEAKLSKNNLNEMPSFSYIAMSPIIVAGLVDVERMWLCCRYDLLVNGGAAVSLVFQRPSFLTQRKNVMVASSSFVVVDTVTLLTADEQTQQEAGDNAHQNCSDDNSAVMPPLIMSSHLLSTISTSCHTLSTVTLESQVTVVTHH